MRRGVLIGAAVLSLALAAPANAAQLLSDGSFDASTSVPGLIPNNFTGDSPGWTEADSVYGTPLCAVPPPTACVDPSGGMVPRTGPWFAWFGGARDIAQTASLTQTVTIPRGKATLSFFLKLPMTGGDGDEVLRVRMDSTELFTATKSTEGFRTAYGQVKRDISGFANGAPHTLTLAYSNPTPNPVTQVVNMAVDDLSLHSTRAVKKCKKRKGRKGAAAAKKKKCKKKKK
jgi:hypothetical protein